MDEYTVEPKSREYLRGLAYSLRHSLGLEDTLFFPVVELLDVFSVIYEDFNYEIIENSALPPSIHADTNITTGLIRIKEDVYVGAANGCGRDRMTIAHEVAHHFMLKFCAFKLYRNFETGSVPAYMSPEWQAKCFAAELLIPAHLTSEMTPAEISKACGVSFEAANYQYMVNRKNKKEVMQIDCF